MTQRLLVGALVVCLGVIARPAATQSLTRLLSCEGPFRPDASADSLARHFGPRNVENANIDIGEGFRAPGTIIFGASPSDRLEVLWLDPSARQRPERVTARQPTASRTVSHWRTPGGLALGMHLRDVERRNRGPFRLAGFGWDYGGTTISWDGGRLATEQPPACHMRARFDTGALLTEERQRWDRQVTGDREFPSRHAAMQALDPYVSEVWLDYPNAEGR